MGWFRVHTSLLNNRKVQALDGKTFKFLVNLWCLAKDGEGVIPKISDIAFQLRMTEQKAEDAVTFLECAGLLESNEDGTFQPHDWDQHQYKSDNVTERVRAFRERFKKQDGNVSETPSETDTDTESETEQKQSKKLATADAVKVWFESEFYPAYPRKKAAAAGLKAARVHLKTPELRAQALRALKLQLPEMKARDPTKVPHPATWINQRRWEDEPDALFADQRNTNYAPKPNATDAVLQLVQKRISMGMDPL